MADKKKNNSQATDKLHSWRNTLKNKTPTKHSIDSNIVPATSPMPISGHISVQPISIYTMLFDN